jgi:elongation factor G
MKNVAVGDTRNFALIGHSHDGKTSVGEALLHTAGATRELGRVDDGSAVLLTEPEEKERKATFSSALYSFDWNGKHFTLVDTPGDPNFLADGQVALAALDGAILVLSAVDGAKVGTETMWRSARRAGASLLAFVNGLDRERADLTAAVESLEKIDAKPALLTLPIGSGEELSGVAHEGGGEGQRGRDPRGARRRGDGGTREARGGRGRVRRHPAREVPRGG